MARWHVRAAPACPGGGALAQEYCPRCGTPRVGSFRFCRSCQLDFNSIPASQPAAAPPAPQQPTAATVSESIAPSTAAPAAASRSIAPGRVLIWVVIGLLVVTGGYLAWQAGIVGPGGIGFGSNVPPVGSIWFGDKYDASSMEINQRRSTTLGGQSMVFVAHLPRSIGPGDADLKIAVDGSTFANQPVQITGSGDLVGFTYVPPIVGTYTFTIVDLGGQVLASGSITAN